MRRSKDMRIAYLTEWTPFAETGVLKKLIGQVITWRELGAVAELYSLSPISSATPALNFSDVGRVVGVLPQSLLDQFPAARLGYINKTVSVRKLATLLRKFKPDVIYYRQNGPWYPGLAQLLAIAPTVFEINTDELSEHHIWGKSFNFLYRSTQGRALAKAHGFVVMTDEIGRRYKYLGRPLAVIPNSFWGDQIVSFPPSGNSRPNFVFVGSRITGTASWHGVDKLIPLAEALSSCHFHIVGHEKSDLPRITIPPNVTLYGFRSASELTDIFRKSDVGIGSLALHRKGMSEACPLKVRDYLMHRLPAVIGYTESESRLNSAPYVLPIGPAEDNVARNFERILKFGEQWLNRRVAADLSFMSRRAKEADRLDFMARIAQAAGSATI
jgi:hypothetical protein